MKLEDDIGIIDAMSIAHEVTKYLSDSALEILLEQIQAELDKRKKEG